MNKTDLIRDNDRALLYSIILSLVAKIVTSLSQIQSQTI